MRRKGIWKKGAALTLVCAVAFSAFALSNYKSYAADPIDVERKCSLTVNLEAVSQDYQNDLKEMKIPISLYKVADVDAGGDFTEVAGFEGLGLDKVHDKTTADEWMKMAQTAEGKLTDTTPVTDAFEVSDGTGAIEGLATGMYLVVPAETYNKDYSYLYKFTPYLTALPGNNYYQSGNDDWIYDAQIGLKVEREMQYGALTISKELTGYSQITQEGYFVFQIEGEKDGVKYSNVASLSFNSDGVQTTVVEHIPAGMDVTVTEVYSGGSYQPEGDTSVTVKIQSDKAVQAGTAGALVKFVNTYDGKLIPGTGVLNQFTAPEGDGDWTWSNSTMEQE